MRFFGFFPQLGSTDNEAEDVISNISLWANERLFTVFCLILVSSDRGLVSLRTKRQRRVNLINSSK